MATDTQLPCFLVVPDTLSDGSVTHAVHGHDGNGGLVIIECYDVKHATRICAALAAGCCDLTVRAVEE